MTDVDVRRRYRTTEGYAGVFYEVTFSTEVAPVGDNSPEFMLEHNELISESALVVGTDGKQRKVKKLKRASVRSNLTQVNDWPRAWAEQPERREPREVAWRYWTIYPGRSSFLAPQKLTIRWIAGATGSAREEVVEISSLNELNRDSTVQLSIGCPQLLALINSPNVPASPESAGASLEDQVGSVLQYICGRLEAGLGAVWRMDESLPLYTRNEGGAPVPMCEADPEALTAAGHLEEAWAQSVSEYLVGTPYLGPGGDYLGGSDTEVFAGAISADPVISIIYACQHLATMSAISRGFDGAAMLPYDAQSAENIRQWDPPGEVHQPPTAVGGFDATAGIESGAVRPGSVYVCPDRVRHIAFVLRALQSRQVQLIDTGAMWPANAAPASSTVHGNYDTHAFNGIRVDRGLKAIGTLGRATRLAEATKRLRASRPMGLARLVILNRLSDDAEAAAGMPERLRYVSPWVPMWDRTSARNYPISRFLWSLRNHPHRDQFEARWLIDVPQRALYRAMAASRSIGVNPRVPGGNQMPVLDIGTTMNGQVRTVGKLVYTTGTGSRNCEVEGCPNFNVRPESWHVWVDPTHGDRAVRSGLQLDRPGRVHADENRPGLALRRAGLGVDAVPLHPLVPATVPSYLRAT
jgi:hypothetical protein